MPSSFILSCEPTWLFQINYKSSCPIENILQGLNNLIHIHHIRVKADLQHIIPIQRIGIRRNSEVLKFSGVVDPTRIQPGNLIASSLVADARLDYSGGGYIEEAQIKGWLSRFFDSFMPF